MDTAILDSGEAEPPDCGLDGQETDRDPEEPPSPTRLFPPVPKAQADFHPTPLLDFLHRHFPGATRREWVDWRWQLSHRITCLEDAARILELSEAETSAIGLTRSSLPLAVTPYYARLLDPKNPQQPLRRMVLPSCREAVRTTGEADDPLGEDGHSPVPGLVHRYPNRVLFLTTDFCSTYCRYCTRSRGMGGQQIGGGGLEHLRQRWEQGLDYISRTPAVQDVLLSGGDPLTMPDEALDWLLTRLRAIKHVQIVRIGTKVPAVLPMRVTTDLARMLKKHHPLWMSLHFTHPGELTEDTRKACARLADAGIPLGSQTVLLSGVNDEPEVMGRMLQGLLAYRVRPYYLYQCDPISGSAHFRTPALRGVEILRALRGRLSGYALPTFVIDAPGGGGKIPLAPDYTLGYSGADLVLRNYAGGVYRYPDPAGAQKAPAQPAMSKGAA
ncbi:MAG: KamA family radical SAM protein [Humidesulfovibrio sp.]|uniref:KamA family radical SAM protein n=1 Tax=Humidesulfovibrio sp. TaxID=2910988 RepID=UPI002734267C|nr:KamA family radical SAM protein [Humidesulfovibrio sp.]MDP2848784.1 KamA family radical SAM protein [Humidesulfovibrio sp.]